MNRLLLACLLCTPAVAQDTPAPAHIAEVFRQIQAFFAETREIPADALALDVEQGVRLALANSARVLQADESIMQREAQSAQARSARRPQLSGQLRYAYTGQINQQIEEGPLVNLALDTDSLELAENIFVSQVSLEQVLYAGGSINAAIAASEYLAESEASRRQATLDQLAFETRQAYYEALLAEALVTVARLSVEIFERHLADAEKALEVGAISKFEVLRARTELGARRSDLEQAGTLLTLAQLNLRRLMGISQHTALNLDDTLAWRALPSDLDALLAQANADRPELQALDSAIAAAQQQTMARRGQYRPRAGALIQYQQVEGGGALLPSGLIASIGVEWDFYTGGRRKHEVLEAESQVRSLEHQRHDVAQLIDLDVRQAHARAAEAAERIRLRFDTVLSGTEGLDLAELRFRQGAGIQAETLDAELALTQARSALVQALRDYMVAMAALDKATGRGNPLPRPTED